MGRLEASRRSRAIRSAERLWSAELLADRSGGFDERLGELDGDSARSARCVPDAHEGSAHSGSDRTSVGWAILRLQRVEHLCGEPRHLSFLALLLPAKRYGNELAIWTT